MTLRKMLPFILALLIFIISNFIQRNLDTQKKSRERQISRIEKDLTSFLQYQSLSSTNFNFAQLHLNAVIENVASGGNASAQKIYMTNVSDQITRGSNDLIEAASSVSDQESEFKEDELQSLEKLTARMKDAAASGDFDGFYSGYMSTFEKIGLLSIQIKTYINKLGQEKVNLQGELNNISTSEKIILNITIAINFFILLVTHLYKNKT